MANKAENMKRYPVIPLRNTMVVPNIITPLLVGRDASLKAAEQAILGDSKIICITQKNNIRSETDPKAKDLYRVGTLCTIMQVLRLPDGTIRLLVEGTERIEVKRF